jgi:hypothetical protein
MERISKNTPLSVVNRNPQFIYYYNEARFDAVNEDCSK